MSKIYYILAFLHLASILSYGQEPVGTDQIIVKLKNPLSDSDKSIFDGKSIGSVKIDSLNLMFCCINIEKKIFGKEESRVLYIIKYPQEINIHKVIDELYETGEVDYAEPDHRGMGSGVKGVTPNDEHFNRQWSLHNDGTFSYSYSVAGADIEMEKAWDLEQGDAEIVTAIIDSGNKLDHPEFEGRIWVNPNETPNNGIDDDSNGYVDDINGWDFANSDNNPTDDLGHGTNVTGIIGANGNNSIGYAGVDWNCKLMSLKGLDYNNYGYYSWWVSAIYYAVDNGAKVINMSLGGTGISATLQNAVNYAIGKNVSVVACMMNTNSRTVYYPAAYSGVIAVGSTNSDDTRSNPFFWSSTSGSNYGDHISVVAPGNYIFGLNHQSNTNYGYYWGGTSQATPHVTGLVSLLLAQNPNRTPAQIKTIIESTAEDKVGHPGEDTQGWDKYYGYGRVNAYNALSAGTSLDDQDDETDYYSTFPNPSNGFFTTSFPSFVKQIQIFNSLGQLLQDEKVEGIITKTFYLNESGVYFVKFLSENKSITKRYVVQK